MWNWLIGRGKKKIFIAYVGPWQNFERGGRILMGRGWRRGGWRKGRGEGWNGEGGGRGMTQEIQICDNIDFSCNQKHTFTHTQTHSHTHTHIHTHKQTHTSWHSNCMDSLTNCSPKIWSSMFPICYSSMGKVKS